MTEINRTRAKRVFTQEFKEEAVKLVTEQGYSYQEATKSLDITDKLLHNWKTKMETQSMLTIKDKARLIALEKENKQLKMEKEILKIPTGHARQQPTLPKS